MRHFQKFAIGVVVFGITVGIAVESYSQQDVPRPLRASATILGATVAPYQRIIGEAKFKQAAPDKDNFTPVTEVEVDIHVKGLPPGKHGFHVHENGVCSPTQPPGTIFGAAGGHFDGPNPDSTVTPNPNPNGNSNPDTNHPYHLGDLPNLEADAKGEAHIHYTTSRITLSPGPLSVFAPNRPNGTALIIHANPDQGGPAVAGTGIAGGPRIACGVIIQEF